MSIGEHASLWYGGVSLGYMHKGDIAGEVTWFREVLFSLLRSETNHEMSQIVAKQTNRLLLADNNRMV